MVMKIFNKGQIVIPATLRRELGVGIGDYLEVEFDRNKRSLTLSPRAGNTVNGLGGSLSIFAKARSPSKRRSLKALKDGLTREI